VTHPLEMEDISKTFHNIPAVQNLSFSLQPGEIFGLLGPNGAGKTTSIRIALDLLRPDSGRVSILGGPMSEAKKERIGYMPEERGLYQDVPLGECLIYLGRLKGLTAAEARQRLRPMLERFDLAEVKKKKVKELSKGMQQKAQIINTILHQPELIIVDEPFASLDPVNTSLVKDLLRQLSREGATILMSSHQMQLVEEMCDRILLIDHGSSLLYGDIEHIRRTFSGHGVMLRTPQDLPDMPGIESCTRQNGSLQISLSEAITPQTFLKNLVSAGVTVEGFEIATPTLDEIFIQVVKGGVQ